MFSSDQPLICFVLLPGEHLINQEWPIVAFSSKQTPCRRIDTSSEAAAQAVVARFSWAARRDTLREPVFLCTTPLLTARISSD
jgi:hypothetical protein